MVSKPRQTTKMLKLSRHIPDSSALKLNKNRQRALRIPQDAEYLRSKSN